MLSQNIPISCQNTTNQPIHDLFHTQNHEFQFHYITYNIQSIIFHILKGKSNNHGTNLAYTVFPARVSPKLKALTQAKEILSLKRALLAWARA